MSGFRTFMRQEIVALKSLRQFFRDGYFNASGCHRALHVMTWRGNMAATTTAKNILTNPVQVTLRLDAALLQQLQESAKARAPAPQPTR
jgi:hypothetical protein